jgi:hypothetical protein
MKARAELAEKIGAVVKEHNLDEAFNKIAKLHASHPADLYPAVKIQLTLPALPKR